MDERHWTDLPLEENETIALEGCEITRIPNCPMALVSGDLEMALADLAPDAPLLGLGGPANKGTFGIRMARDTALLVGDRAGVDAGWSDRGYALSAADGLYMPLDITGQNARGILAQGTSVDPDSGSPSAACLFAGASALLTGTVQGYTLWIEAAHLTYVSSFLRRAFSASL